MATEALTTPEATAEGAPSRRWRGRTVVAAAVVAIAAAAGVLATSASGQEAPIDEVATPRAVATVERQDIVTTTTLDGTLTYDDARTLAAGRSGVITWVPEVGSVIGFGEPLYEVDGQPVILLPGTMPSYRDLNDGVVDGDDVTALEQALVDLGHAADTDLTVDREFTSVTASVVETFREAVGLSEVDSGDDELALGEVAYAPDLVRVAGRSVSLGDAVGSGAPVLSVTTPKRVVTVSLDAGDQGLVAEGDVVEVELPDATIAPATVTYVSSVAEVVETNNGTTSTLAVEITLDSGGDGFDEAPVEVAVVDVVAEGVLVVPVEAILALAEGGYALEIVEGDTTRLVPILIGDFADGVVEVQGNQVTEGMEVVSA